MYSVHCEGVGRGQLILILDKAVNTINFAKNNISPCL